jgi:transcriptional regulator with XRE-family HTH domain
METTNARVLRPVESFGQRLRRLRKERGLSRQVLADTTAIHQTGLSGYERDVFAPGMWNLIALSRALDVTIDYLCGEVRDA